MTANMHKRGSDGSSSSNGSTHGGDDGSDVYVHGMAAEATRMLSSTLPGVVIRHTRRADVAAIAQMLQQQRYAARRQRTSMDSDRHSVSDKGDGNKEDDDDDDDCAASAGVWGVQNAADVAALVESSVVSLTALCRVGRCRGSGNGGSSSSLDGATTTTLAASDSHLHSNSGNNETSSDGDDMIVCGVLVLSDSPHTPLPSQPAAVTTAAAAALSPFAAAPLQWEATLHSGHVSATAIAATATATATAAAAQSHVDVRAMHSCNTLWLSLLATRSPACVRAELRKRNSSSSSSSATLHNDDKDGDGAEEELAAMRAVTATPLARELLRIMLGVHASVQHVLLLAPPHAHVPPLSLTPPPPSPPHTVAAAVSSPPRHTRAAAATLPCERLSWRDDDDDNSNTTTAAAATAARQLWHLARARVLPPLQLRPGRVEDYDDFVPLLLRGCGVLTRLPSAFYLDEELMQQDDVHKVVVAEDAQTHEVVGLACLRALDAAAQQHLTRRYHTQHVGKFAALDLDAAVRSARARATATRRAVANAFHIAFLYFAPAYHDRVGEFVQYMFAQYASCEYATLTLPHDTPDTPVLRAFAYVPLRSYQPPQQPPPTPATVAAAVAVTRTGSSSNNNNDDEDDEVASMRRSSNNNDDAMGLWVCCRYALDDVTVAAVRSRDACEDLDVALQQHFDHQHHYHGGGSNGNARHKQSHSLLDARSDSLGSGGVGGNNSNAQTTTLVGGDATAALLCADLRCSLEGDHNNVTSNNNNNEDTNKTTTMPSASFSVDDTRAHTTVFVLRWRGDVVVGAASLRRLTLRDVYALRANYDLDAYVDVHALPPPSSLPAARSGARDYRATDVTLTPRQAQAAAVSRALRGVVVRALYIRPPLRAALRFFVRDMLRQMDAHVAVVLAGGAEAVDVAPSLHPLLAELLPVRPRRVREQRYSYNDNDDEGDEDVVYDASRPQRHQIDHTTDVAALGALFCTTRRYLADAKLRIHTRIVVVGASATGLACLHRLLMVPYVHYSNLVLVSCYGLPPHANALAVQWHADTMALLEREHACLHVGRPVRVVAGSLVDVDRAQRYVALDNGTYEAYDYLLLTVGRQYVVPPVLQSLLQQEGRAATTAAAKTTTSAAVTPTAAAVNNNNNNNVSNSNSSSGILALADELAMDTLQQRLAEIDQNVNNVANVMVYGAGLDALATVTAMVQLGFSAQRIVLCSRTEAVPMMDAANFAVVVSLLKSMGVHVMRGYDVTRIEYDEDNNLATVVIAPACVTATGATSSSSLSSSSTSPSTTHSNGGARVTAVAGRGAAAARAIHTAVGDRHAHGGNHHHSHTDSSSTSSSSAVTTTARTNNGSAATAAAAAGQAVELSCCLIVALEDKDIDPRVLTMLNRRSIVFDGRVIVESDYRASDARVMAAGPVAMFTRRYGATRSFDDSAACDVGAHMARVLLGAHLHLDEFCDATSSSSGDNKSNQQQQQCEQQQEQHPLHTSNGSDDNAAAATNEVYRKVLEENGSVLARRRARHACVSDAQRERAARATLQRLPRYTTPLARRVRLPAGCCYFVAQSTDFCPAECLRLDCSNVDVQRLLAAAGDTSAMTAAAAVSGAQRSASDDKGDDDGVTAGTADGEEQYMLTIYVNQHSRAIDAVSYLGNGRPEVHHYYTLIGYPESLLDLVYRYREAAALAEAHATTAAVAADAATPVTTVGRHVGASAAGLTAGLVGGKLDLVAYLRLPHMQCIFDERFGVFFRALRERLRAHAQAVALRKRILHEHRLECYLPEQAASAYVDTLTQAGHGAFAREVQLQLLRFLHENKDFLPQNMYLPDITAHVHAYDAL